MLVVKEEHAGGLKGGGGWGGVGRGDKHHNISEEISAEESVRVKQGEDYVLFCLDGVGRSHVVAGDVAALSRRQGPGEPPVPFSVTQTGREGRGRREGQRSATSPEWTQGKKKHHTSRRSVHL